MHTNKLFFPVHFCLDKLGLAPRRARHTSVHAYAYASSRDSSHGARLGSR